MSILIRTTWKSMWIKYLGCTVFNYSVIVLYSPTRMEYTPNTAHPSVDEVRHIKHIYDLVCDIKFKRSMPFYAACITLLIYVKWSYGFFDPVDHVASRSLKLFQLPNRHLLASSYRLAPNDNTDKDSIVTIPGQPFAQQLPAATHSLPSRKPKPRDVPIFLWSPDLMSDRIIIEASITRSRYVMWAGTLEIPGPELLTFIATSKEMVFYSMWLEMLWRPPDMVSSAVISAFDLLMLAKQGSLMHRLASYHTLYFKRLLNHTVKASSSCSRLQSCTC